MCINWSFHRLVVIVLLSTLSAGAERQYAVVESRLSWHDAEAYCKQIFGGHLLSVTSSDVNSKLVNILRQNRVSGAWIGYSDAEREWEWTWSNRNANGSCYRNWDNKEPDDCCGVENCAMMEQSGRWHDVRCTNTYPFVCEMGKMEEFIKCDGLKIAVSRPREQIITRDKLLAVIPTLTRSYTLTFEVKPAIYRSEWTNVIRLTSTSGNCCGTSGDRIPAVFFHPGRSSKHSTNKFHICSVVNGNGNFCYDSKEYTVETGKWTKVVISQLREPEGYRYTVMVSGVVLGSTINRAAREFTNVEVYASDNFYDTAQGTIRNLIIELGGGDGFEGEMTDMWCADNSDPHHYNNICNGTRSDCVSKGKSVCSNDRSCFGIMYSEGWAQRFNGVKKCDSRRLVWKGNWKTYLKIDDGHVIKRPDQFPYGAIVPVIIASCFLWQFIKAVREKYYEEQRRRREAANNAEAPTEEVTTDEAGNQSIAMETHAYDNRSVESDVQAAPSWKNTPSAPASYTTHPPPLPTIIDNTSVNTPPQYPPPVYADVPSYAPPSYEDVVSSRLNMTADVTLEETRDN